MMRKFLLVMIVALNAFVSVAGDSDPNAGIIPAPVSVQRNPGYHSLSAQVIVVDDPNDKAAIFLADYLKMRTGVGLRARLTSAVPAKIPAIILTSRGADKLPIEGYKLTIDPKNITIVGKGAGIFYGIQTLIQLLPNKFSSTIKIPCMVINDHPRFGYRGLMLDVSRHFFTINEVKDVIDLMASYKLNNFHWHLVDNEGWRLESKKYPKLTSVGAYRTTTGVWYDNRDWPDGKTYGGFYTQDQIREVVKYASDRYITIIPEIEVPAHSMAALNAYPELKCDTVKNSKDPTAFDYIYCPTEKTFSFLEDVLTEVLALFPSKFIHIGGDEANKQPWEEATFTRDLIQKLGVKDVHGLQSYFISRVEKFLNSKGRSIIGWDEILEGGLAPNATVMSWRGEEGGIKAAKQKHDVIMTPNPNGMYFDYYQSTSDREPITIGGYATLEKTYSYDPVPPSLSGDEKHHVLGVQGNVWTEYIANVSKMQYMMLPRMFALAEIAWTPVDKKDYEDFLEKRLPQHLSLLDKSGSNYRVPPAFNNIDTVLIGNKFTLDIKPSVPRSKIYYTLNGLPPDDTDLEYRGSLEFSIPENEKRELQTIVITPAGRRSVVTKTVMYNRKPLSPVDSQPSGKGMKYTLNSVQTMQPLDSGTIADFDNTTLKKKSVKGYMATYEGLIDADETGLYHFSLVTYEGGQVYLGDELVVDFMKPYNLRWTSIPKTGSIPLQKGYHKIKIKYIDNGENAPLQLTMWREGNKPKLVEVMKP